MDRQGLKPLLSQQQTRFVCTMAEGSASQHLAVSFVKLTPAQTTVPGAALGWLRAYEVLLCPLSFFLWFSHPVIMTALEGLLQHRQLQEY